MRAQGGVTLTMRDGVSCEQISHLLEPRSPFAQPPLTLVLLLLPAARWALPVLIQRSNECIAK